MAQIHNTDLFKELKDGIKIQQMRDVIPSQLAEKVVPVMEVNPKLLRRINVMKKGAASNATSSTIYTTPTDKDFFLTNATICAWKDVTAVAASQRLNVTIDGAVTPIFTIETLTLTAIQPVTASLNFSCPLKIDRGTGISVTNDNATANTKVAATIFGYLVDNITA